MTKEKTEIHDFKKNFNINSRSKNKVNIQRAIFFGTFSVMLLILMLTIIILGEKGKINMETDYLSITLITLDSLLTGATITLIAFSNLSPDSSSSGHMYKSIYWKTSEVGGTSKRSFVGTAFSGAFLKPLTVLLLTVFATGTEAILLIFDKHFKTIYIDVAFMVMLFITFWLLISTISRYFLYNKNPARVASLYIYRILNEGNETKMKQKNEKDNKKIAQKIKNNKVYKKHYIINIDKFHEIINLISYIKGTKNNEFIVLIIRRINKIMFSKNQDEKSFIRYITDEVVSMNKIKVDKKTIASLDTDRYLMKFNPDDTDIQRKFKLLLLTYRFIMEHKNENNGDSKYASYVAGWAGIHEAVKVLSWYSNKVENEEDAVYEGMNNKINNGQK